jgi:aquaporin Z
MPLSKRFVAEMFGTFWLVFGGCGTAVMSAAFPNVGVGLVGVSLAFGLTVLTMAYAIGHVSGCHLNPAVTLGLVAGGRFPAKDAPAYIAAQVAGGIAGAGVLFVIASGAPGFSVAGGFASNGFGDHSPGHYSAMSCFVAEVVLTFAFLVIILGATHKKAPAGFAPIAIGLGLTLIHLIGGGWALAQLALFWVAPILGGLVAGGFSRFLFDDEPTMSDKVQKTTRDLEGKARDAA